MKGIDSRFPDVDLLDGRELTPDPGELAPCRFVVVTVFLTADQGLGSSRSRA